MHPPTGPKFPIVVPVSGARYDIDRFRLNDDQLQDSVNWIYTNGKLRVRDGSYTEVSSSGLTGTPIAFAALRKNDGTLIHVCMTTTAWHKYTPKTAISGTPTTWTALTGTLTGSVMPGVFRQFQKGGVNYLIGTNAIEVPKKWDGAAASISDVGGSPPKCGAMMVLNNRLVLGNLTSGGTTGQNVVTYSSINDFEAGWATNFDKLDNTPESIIAMLELSFERGAIYKRDEIVIATAGAGAGAFTYQSYPASVVGPVSRGAVCKMPDGSHAFLDRNGAIQIFDGNTIRTAGNHIQAMIGPVVVDNDDAIYSTMLFDSRRRMLRVFIPQTSGPAIPRDFAINIDDWTVWPIRRTADIRAAGFDGRQQYLRLITTNGTTGMEFEFSVKDFIAYNGATYTATDFGTIEMVGPIIAAGIPERHKTLNAIVHQLDNTVGVTNLVQEINIAADVYTDTGPVTYSVTQALGVGKYYYNQTFRKSFRYLALRTSLTFTYTQSASIPALGIALVYSGGELYITQQGMK